MKTIQSIPNRMKGYYRRTAAEFIARRPRMMTNERALVSFTFDDFPRSALFNAGDILERHAIRGTYYASFGLMGKMAPTGEIFQAGDLPFLFDHGHEVGCHTFTHCHAYDTTAETFERSILENARALRSLAPTVEFKTLSYPISAPRPETKRRIEKYFAACRGGGQTYNCATVDLNQLRAYFLEQSRGTEEIDHVLEASCRANGWLIFATHDVSDNPTRFGCTPTLFQYVVDRARESGAEILPVSEAFGKAFANKGGL